jgi:hypothetical protein
MQVTADALTIWPPCAHAVHIHAPSLSQLYMCYEFLGSKEEKMYFAYRFHVNTHTHTHTCMRMHLMKFVNETGQKFCAIFEKDLSQILNRFGTWAFPVFWHSCSAAICTCTATFWLCAHHVCQCPFQCSCPWWTGGWNFAFAQTWDYCRDYCVAGRREAGETNWLWRQRKTTTDFPSLWPVNPGTSHVWKLWTDKSLTCDLTVTALKTHLYVIARYRRILFV